MPRTTQTRGKGRTLAPRSAGVEGNNPARGPAAVDAGAPVPPGMPGKLQDLRPAPYNPREISPEAMAALGAGLSRFGDLSGIVWNKATGHVVSGHQRLERARKDGGRLVVRGAQAQVVVKGARGYEVPVRVVDWPLEMEKAANLAANNPASQGRFTPAVLHLVAELTDLDLDLSQELRLGDIATALGPDPLEDTPAAQDMAAAPSAAAEAAPVEADRIALEPERLELSEHVITHGDAVRFLRQLEPGSVDGIVTDPPYSSGGAFRSDRARSTGTKYQSSDAKRLHEFQGDGRDQRSWQQWATAWLEEALRITRPGGWFVLFVDWRQLPALTDAVQAAGWIWRGVAVWDKIQARPQPGRFRQQAEFVVWGTNGHQVTEKKGAKYLPGVFSIGAPSTSEREHATQKPVALLRALLGLFEPGDTIVDPFMGTGTTGVAAALQGMRFYGCDNGRHWVDVARRRITEATEGRYAEDKDLAVVAKAEKEVEE